MPTLTPCPTHKKILVLLRGLPSTAKSTFVQDNGLEDLLLSPEYVRSPRQALVSISEIGHEMSPVHLKREHQQLQEGLENRLKKGAFSVVDMTDATTDDLQTYKQLAEKHDYRMVCVDFTDLSTNDSKDDILHSNQTTNADILISYLEGHLHNTPIPDWLPTIHPSQYRETVAIKPVNLSNYRKIHMIGDIHGCYDALCTYMPNVIPDNELFLFTGDYIDRGIQNAKTLSYLFKHMNRPNFVFLEGNHESHLWRWANGLPSYSKREFERYTKPDLEDGLINKKTARLFYRNLQPFLYFTYNEKEVLVTHGGLPSIPSDLHLLSPEQLIKGVGDYTADVDALFSENRSIHQYQVHGHRNLYGKPVLSSDTSFNIEGKIEKGGHLRVVTLDASGFTPITIQNETFSDRFVSEKTSPVFVRNAFTNPFKKDLILTEVRPNPHKTIVTNGRKPYAINHKRLLPASG